MKPSAFLLFTFFSLSIFHFSYIYSYCLSERVQVKYRNADELVPLSTIVLNIGQWETQQIHAQIGKILIEEKLGYPVSFWPTDNANNYTNAILEYQTINKLNNSQHAETYAISNGDVDLMFEGWIDTQVSNTLLAAGPVPKIEDVGIVGYGGQTGLYIPTYLAITNPRIPPQGPKLNNFQRLFLVNNTPTIYVASLKYRLNNYTQLLLQNFNLNYTIIETGSEESLYAVVAAANQSQSPILIVTSYPSAVLHSFPMTRINGFPVNPCMCLESPCFLAGKCDFPIYEYDKLISSELDSKSKQILFFSERYKIYRDDMEPMLYQVITNQSSVYDVACEWVQRNTLKSALWLLTVNWTTCNPPCQHGPCIRNEDGNSAICQCDYGWAGLDCGAKSADGGPIIILLFGAFIAFLVFLLLLFSRSIVMVGFLGRPLLCLTFCDLLLYFHQPLFQSQGVQTNCHIMYWLSTSTFPCFLSTIMIGLLRYRQLRSLGPVKEKWAMTNKIRRELPKKKGRQQHLTPIYYFILALFARGIIYLIVGLIIWNENIPSDEIGCMVAGNIFSTQIFLNVGLWVLFVLCFQKLPTGQGFVGYRTESIYLFIYGCCLNLLYYAFLVQATTFQGQYTAALLLWAVPHIYVYRTMLAPVLHKWRKGCFAKCMKTRELPPSSAYIATSLKDLIETRQGFDYFLFYCREEFTEQYLYAWQSVSAARLNPSINELQEIYDKYLSRNAPLRINYPHRYKSQIRALLTTSEGHSLSNLQSFLTNLQQEIYQTMLTSSWPRFRNTESYEIFAHNLARARDEAVESTKAKSMFLANMSHEIRTPLNGVLGLARILMDTFLNEDQRDLLTTIIQSGKQLLAVINDILDLSKLDSGKMTLESVQFSPLLCVESVLSIFARQTQQKGIDLVCNVIDGYSQVFLADTTRLRQILTNLIGNAIKFTYHGEVIVTIDMTPAWTSKGVIYFSVRDTGIGIPESKIKDQLFQPFVQVDNSHTRKFGGTGLGLVISKKLIEAMGGTIWVHSPREEGSPAVENTEGPGTTFHFTIQMQRPINFEGKLAVVDELEIARNTGELEGKNVLIIDREASAKSIASHLRKCNMVVTIFRSYSDYLKPQEIKSYDFIFVLESCLPNFPVLNRDHFSRDSKVILMSWTLNSAQKQATLDLGFHGVLSKPIRRLPVFRLLLPSVTWPVDPGALDGEEIELEESEAHETNQLLPTALSPIVEQAEEEKDSVKFWGMKAETPVRERLPLMMSPSGSEDSMRPNSLEALTQFSSNLLRLVAETDEDSKSFSNRLSSSSVNSTPISTYSTLQLPSSSPVIGNTSSFDNLFVFSEPASESTSTSSLLASSVSSFALCPSTASALDSSTSSSTSVTLTTSFTTAPLTDSLSTSIFSSSFIQSFTSTTFNSSSVPTVSLLSSTSTIPLLTSTTTKPTSSSKSLLSPGTASDSPVSISTSLSSINSVSIPTPSPGQLTRRLKSDGSTSSRTSSLGSLDSGLEMGVLSSGSGAVLSSSPSPSPPLTKKKKVLKRNHGAKKPLSILVAEDNLINQKVVRRMLSHIGYDCEIANDGIEAIEKLKEKNYEVILMDLQMPRMGGLDASKAIRENFPLTKQPVIVALTANVLPAEKALCAEAGMEEFLGKPLELAALTNVLAAIYNRLHSHG